MKKAYDTPKARLAEILNMVWPSLYYPTNRHGDTRICFAIHGLYRDGKISEQENHDAQDVVVEEVLALSGGTSVMLHSATRDHLQPDIWDRGLRELAYTQFRDGWLRTLIAKLGA